MAHPRSDSYKARHMPSAIRLPLQPLLDMLQFDDYAMARLTHRGSDDMAVFAERGIPLRSADTLAVGLAGRHPYEVWGDLWWADVLPSTQEVTK